MALILEKTLSLCVVEIFDRVVDLECSALHKKTAFHGKVF